MKENRFYTCKYCYKEFEPTRRRVQKYCSNSCRSKAYHLRNSKTDNTLVEKNHTDALINVPKVPKEKISMSGIGNAAAGTLLADGVKALLIREKNKAATKEDINLIIEKLKGRYHLVKNIPPNHDGTYPYYDIIENIIVFI